MVYYDMFYYGEKVNSIFDVIEKKIMSCNKELNFYEFLFFNDDCIYNEKNVYE